jgi:hypothetical protein
MWDLLWSVRSNLEYITPVLITNPDPSLSTPYLFYGQDHLTDPYEPLHAALVSLTPSSPSIAWNFSSDRNGYAIEPYAMGTAAGSVRGNNRDNPMSVVLLR